MSKITKIHAREILDSRETRRWRWTLIWKAERQLARPFQAERQPVPKKRGSSATATKKIFGQRSSKSGGQCEQNNRQSANRQRSG